MVGCWLNKEMHAFLCLLIKNAKNAHRKRWSFAIGSIGHQCVCVCVSGRIKKSVFSATVLADMTTMKGSWREHG
jgi:hypothetical protein